MAVNLLLFRSLIPLLYTYVLPCSQLKLSKRYFYSSIIYIILPILLPYVGSIVHVPVNTFISYMCQTICMEYVYVRVILLDMNYIFYIHMYISYARYSALSQCSMSVGIYIACIKIKINFFFNLFCVNLRLRVEFSCMN